MPWLYLFLAAIAAGVTTADKLLYDYDYWYIQGAAMLVMVIITACVFGCGRVKGRKREMQQA